MRYSARADEGTDRRSTNRRYEASVLWEPLEAVVRGLGLALIELDVFRTKSRKGSPAGARVRVIVYKAGVLGTDDCSRAHRAMLPLLEQAFPGSDLYLEVSSPGITRQIKDGAELAHYRGRGLRLWRTDISDWSAGLLEAADEQGITITGKEGTVRLDYAVIAKARLDPSQED
ncbi:MAG: ribosome assembly cofactor RimP [Treponema sp.]|nr:ribosome assembly cofactor RimP [Treponema sp.]